ALRHCEPVQIETKNNLKQDTEYTFSAKDSTGKVLFEFKFKTQPDPAADSFSFLLGSCAYMGRGFQKLAPHGSPKIFGKMKNEQAGFMLWMGDNCYYIGNEFNSRAGMMKKQLKVHRNKYVN